MGIYSMGRLLLIILTDKCITDKCIIDVIWVLCLYINENCNGPKSLFAIIQVKLFFLVALYYIAWQAQITMKHIFKRF